MNKRREKMDGGIIIGRVDSRYIAWKAGLRKNDKVTAVNGNRVGDDLDFFFHAASDSVKIEFIRRSKKKTVTFVRVPGEQMGIDFFSPPVRRCANRCIFCFIDQLPPGLRKSLYVKDEDCRHSFLNGNYVTLASLSRNDLERIVSIKLSPLYISVHATNLKVRRMLLGNTCAPPILEQLTVLEKNDIQFHTQVVVCPGVNDGAILEKTIADLLKFKRGLLSIAVVPVGLTRYRTFHLSPVTNAHARRISFLVMRLSDRDMRKGTVRRLYLADELYIKAGLPIPSLAYYNDFPQIENGVGLVRLFLTQWSQLKKELIKKKHPSKAAKKIGVEKQARFIIITSLSAYSYLHKIVDELHYIYSGILCSVVPVKNSYFGEQVTVAGLLTAHDIITQIKTLSISFTKVIAPAVLFNYRGYTLDGYSKKRLESRIGKPMAVVKDMYEMISIIEKDIHGKTG